MRLPQPGVTANPHSKYLAQMAAFFLGGSAVLLALAAAFVMRSGEISSARDVAFRQNQQAGAIAPLYGPALQNVHFQYKLALLDARHPEIVAIGSSRVFAFRQVFFNRPFANLGGNMNDPEEGRQFVEAMLARRVPKIAILNLDFWWFNPSYPAPTTFPTHALDGTHLRYEDYLVLEKWLTGGRFGLREIAQTLTSPQDPVDGLPAGIGILAKFGGEGFAPDGSEFDFGLVRGTRSAWDRNFAQALGRIRSGVSEYAHADGFSEEAWRGFAEIVSRLTSAGVKAVVIVPPIARHVSSEIGAREARYPHIPAMLAHAASLGVPVFDFSNLDALGGSDCEFIDSVHVGDVGGLRMARALASDPRSPLMGSVDLSWADREIASGTGRALLPEGMAGVAGKEIDFLNLGCAKG